MKQGRELRTRLRQVHAASAKYRDTGVKIEKQRVEALAALKAFRAQLVAHRRNVKHMFRESVAAQTAAEKAVTRFEATSETSEVDFVSDWDWLNTLVEQQTEQFDAVIEEVDSLANSVREASRG